MVYSDCTISVTMLTRMAKKIMKVPVMVPQLLAAWRSAERQSNSYFKKLSSVFVSALSQDGESL